MRGFSFFLFFFVLCIRPPRGSELALALLQRAATKIVIRVRDYRSVRHSGKEERRRVKKTGGEKAALVTIIIRIDVYETSYQNEDSREHAERTKTLIGQGRKSSTVSWEFHGATCSFKRATIFPTLHFPGVTLESECTIERDYAIPRWV